MKVKEKLWREEEMIIELNKFPAGERNSDDVQNEKCMRMKSTPSISVDQIRSFPNLTFSTQFHGTFTGNKRLSLQLFMYAPMTICRREVLIIVFVDIRNVAAEKWTLSFKLNHNRVENCDSRDGK